MISPYVARVSSRLRNTLDAHGVATVAFDSFDEPEERKVARIDPVSLAEAAIEIGNQSQSDAVFMSCTNLRTLDIIDEIEAKIGKPVLSSNQVLAWHLAKLSGLAGPATAPGRLWQT